MVCLGNVCGDILHKEDNGDDDDDDDDDANDDDNNTVLDVNRFQWLSSVKE
jgi:hypothetical protein